MGVLFRDDFIDAAGIAIASRPAITGGNWVSPGTYGSTGHLTTDGTGHVTSIDGSVGNGEGAADIVALQPANDIDLTVYFKFNSAWPNTGMYTAVQFWNGGGFLALIAGHGAGPNNGQISFNRVPVGQIDYPVTLTDGDHVVTFTIGGGNVLIKLDGVLVATYVAAALVGANYVASLDCAGLSTDTTQYAMPSVSRFMIEAPAGSHVDPGPPAPAFTPMGPGYSGAQGNDPQFAKFVPLVNHRWKY